MKIERLLVVIGAGIGLVALAVGLVWLAITFPYFMLMLVIGSLSIGVGAFYYFTSYDGPLMGICHTLGGSITLGFLLYYTFIQAHEIALQQLASDTFWSVVLSFAAGPVIAGVWAILLFFVFAIVGVGIKWCYASLGNVADWVQDKN